MVFSVNEASRFFRARSWCWVRRARHMPPSSKARHDEASLNAIRTYLEENLPDDAPLEEKSMFGCYCFMVRGHIFIAMKYDGTRILVRVGKEQMDDAVKLDGASQGPIQCAWVDAPHFKGDTRFKVWFDLAATFNAMQEAKQCDEEKPGKKRKRRRAERHEDRL